MIERDDSYIRGEIVALLHAARTASVRSVNALMTASYWEIGPRIDEFEQQGGERAEYGEALVGQLAGRSDPAIRLRIQSTQPLEDARLLLGVARERDSLDTVERIVEVTLT